MTDDYGTQVDPAVPSRGDRALSHLKQWGGLYTAIGLFGLMIAFGGGALVYTANQNAQEDKNARTTASIQQQRFDNLATACDEKNEDRRGNRQFVLLLTAAAPRDGQDEARRREQAELARDVVGAFYPNEPDCRFVAYLKACKPGTGGNPGTEQSAPCRAYRRENDLAQQRRAYERRQRELRETKAQIARRLAGGN